MRSLSFAPGARTGSSAMPQNLWRFGFRSADFSGIEEPIRPARSSPLPLAMGMKPLEKDGVIEVVSSPRKKRYAFPAGTTLRFLVT